MKKILLTAMCCIGLTIGSYSQNGQLPPVTFSPNSNVCDNSPWKLVFQDYFDGEQLGAPWITFTSWAGMPGGDNDDWGGARTMYDRSIIKDQNVVVSNGTCKLIVKKEPASWRCATCSMTTVNKDYTSGMIATPYTKSFNTGKFEARIKMPTFKWAHSTFWTWKANDVNEIDIAEVYGQTIGGLWGGFPRVNYSLHAWAPEHQPNPYNMQHVEVRNRYPNQTWWNWLSGTGFKMDDFHTYTCEWDTAVVKFYMDGSFGKRTMEILSRKIFYNRSLAF